MGIVFRQSIKSGIIYLAGALLGAASTYLTTVVFMPEHAGITRNLITQASVIQSFLVFGLPSTLFVYIPRLRDEPLKQKTLNAVALILPLITTLLFFVVYFSFRELFITRYQVKDQPYIRQYFYWMPLFTLIWCYISVLELYLLSQMKAAASAFMREVLLRILLILLIVFYYFGWINLHQFVVTTILVHIAPLLGLAFIAAKTPNFGLALSRDAFSGAEIKKLLSFAWYHLLSSITSYLMGYLDMLILASQSVKGLADAQIYSVAIFLVSFLVLPYRSMINAATPKINEAYHNNDMSLMKNLFIRSSDNMLIGVLAMWLLILPNMHNAEALLKADYKGITAIVLILSIGRVTDVITGPNSELIGLSKHYKFLFRSTLLLVVAIVVLDRLFIPRYGIYAAAWVTTLCTMIYNIAKMVFLYVKMKIQPFNKATAGILLSAGLACVPAYFLPTAVNAFLDTFYRTAITLPVYVAALYLLKASPDLNTYIASIRKNKRLF